MISADEIEPGEVQDLTAGNYPESISNSYRIIKTGEHLLRVEPYDQRRYAEISYGSGDYKVVRRENWNDPWNDFIDPHLEELNLRAADPKGSAQMNLQLAYREALEEDPLNALGKMRKGVDRAEEFAGSFDRVELPALPGDESQNAYFWYGNSRDNLKIHIDEDDPEDVVTALIYAAGKIALRDSDRKPVINTGCGHKMKEHHIRSEEFIDPEYLVALDHFDM